MKYIKLFESFDSSFLKRTLAYIVDKELFISKLKSICARLDFPLSKLNDSYFNYLPYDKAFNLNSTNFDNKCDASSISVFGSKGLEDEFCHKGLIMRKWGSGVRTIDCPECNGTGYKRLSINNISSGISLYKFWFNENGELIITTFMSKYSDVNYIERNFRDPVIVYKDSNLLNDAKFAIILDLELLKKDSLSVSKIQNKRDEMRKGATSLMTDQDIISMNYEKYISSMLDKYNIEGITDIKSLYLRLLPKKYSVFYLTDVSSSGRYIINNLYDALRYKNLLSNSSSEDYDDIYKKYVYNNKELIFRIKNLLNRTLNYRNEYDSFMKKNSNYEFNDIISNEINSLVLRTDMDSIEAFEVLNAKINMVERWIYETGFRNYYNAYPGDRAFFSLPEKSVLDRLIKMIKKL